VKRILHWPNGPVVLVVLGVAILALPTRLEGPPLWPIATGHALSLVDAIGVLPLVGGSVWLHAGLWRRRGRLGSWAATRPGAAGALAFAAGLGLGLLLASAFSAFFWWWAVGAALFVAANAAAVTVVLSRRAAEGA
jgi:hypothetical protein